MRILSLVAITTVVTACLIARAQPLAGPLSPEQAERHMSLISAAVDRPRMIRALTADTATLDRFIRVTDVTLAGYAISEAKRRNAVALVPALAARMENPRDNRTSIQAAQTLRYFNLPEAKRSLLKGIQDRRLEVRAVAAISLAWFGDRRATPVLREGLGSNSPHTRILSAGSLGNLRDKGAVPALIRMADSVDSTERRFVCKPLADIGTPAAIRKLARMVSEEQYAGTRAVAVRELGRVGTKHHLPTFLKALNDKASRVRYEAVLAVERIGDPAPIHALQRAAHSQAADEKNTGYGRRTRAEAERVLQRLVRKGV